MQRYFESLRLLAQRHPARKALAFYQDDSASVVTYGELYRDVLRRANAAGAARAGDLVIISSRTDYPSILSYLAALHNGAHPAFLGALTARQDPQVFHAELALLMERFAPNSVLAETFADSRLHDRRFLADDRPGFVQFSSGTTGLRKGVFISERRLLAQLDSLSRQIQISDADIIACWLPLYHDMGLITSLLLPLYFGAAVAFLDPVEWSYRPESIFQVIERERATLCWQPDFAFRHLVNRYARADVAGQYRLDSLRLLINCSEPCRTRTFAEFWSRFKSLGLAEGSLQTCYAMAENVFAVTHSAFQGEDSWRESGAYLSSGRPLAGCAVRVAAPAGEDEFGEVQVSGSCLFDGYLRHAAPRDKLAEGWFATGDLGYMKDGELYVVGRADDTLIINGRKILAHQLEDHVGQLPGVRPGRVICVANAGNSAVTILYEGDELDTAVLRQVRAWCATASGASVDRVTRLEPGTLVKSSSGKLARTKTLQKLARLNLG